MNCVMHRSSQILSIDSRIVDVVAIRNVCTRASNTGPECLHRNPQENPHSSGHSSSSRPLVTHPATRGTLTRNARLKKHDGDSSLLMQSGIISGEGATGRTAPAGASTPPLFRVGGDRSSSPRGVGAGAHPTGGGGRGLRAGASLRGPPNLGRGGATSPGRRSSARALRHAARAPAFRRTLDGVRLRCRAAGLDDPVCPRAGPCSRAGRIGAADGCPSSSAIRARNRGRASNRGDAASAGPRGTADAGGV